MYSCCIQPAMSVFSMYSACDDVDVNTDVFDVYSVITQYVLVSVLTEYEYSEYSCVFKRILTMNSGEFCIRSENHGCPTSPLYSGTNSSYSMCIPGATGGA